MANFFSILALRPQEQYEKEKDRTLKDELPRSVGAQYATGDQWRTNSRKNEETKPKQKQHPVVDVTGDGSKLQCCKEQFCIRTWHVRMTFRQTGAVSSRDEIPHVQGQELRLRGDTPPPMEKKPT